LRPTLCRKEERRKHGADNSLGHTAECYYCDYMKLMVLKVSRIGNSRGIRLPAAMLRKYHITETVIAEEKSDEIVLRPGRIAQPKLSWKATADAMAAAREDWSEWESTSGDGLHGL